MGAKDGDRTCCSDAPDDRLRICCENWPLRYPRLLGGLCLLRRGDVRWGLTWGRLMMAMGISHCEDGRPRRPMVG